MSWDLNLCMQSRNRVVVPFHHFVSAAAQSISRPSCLQSFPFLRLPIDIQLIIYEFCDGPTLFQLMRTCSQTRPSASKLFWENTSTDHWYCCQDAKLFEYDSWHTILPHSPVFAARIRKVELDLLDLHSRFEWHFRNHWDDEMPGASTAMKAKDFWLKVEKIFPSITSVVLSGCLPFRTCPPQPDEFHEEYATLEAVVKCAPEKIGVSISLNFSSEADPNATQQCCLWQVADGPQPMWRILDPDWKPTRVLLPNRKWTVSPLGDYMTFHRGYQSLALEMRGLKWLMIESYARYAAPGPIHCPRLDCSATFRQRDLWTQHLHEAGHQEFDMTSQAKGDNMRQLLCCKHTPEFEGQFMEARRGHLIIQHAETKRLERRVGHGWGLPGSEQRWLFEEEFVSQMKKENVFPPQRSPHDSTDYHHSHFGGLHHYFVHRLPGCSAIYYKVL